jgi:hypothetical protein
MKNLMFNSKNYLNITLLIVSILLFIYIIKWGNYLIKTKKINIVEDFTSFAQSTIDMGTPQTSHSVDLPINTTFSCQNMCGPLARCSKTGEQCTSDVDCFGCQPKIFVPKYTAEEVGGQNDAGKLTGGFTPTYSTLTTDIGTQAKLYSKANNNKNSDPPLYFKGVDQWTTAFNTGMEIYNKKFNPSIEILPYVPKYPLRNSLSGEFVDDGPLAANAFL